MKIYPIYKVKANYKARLSNLAGEVMDINAGDIGTFQAITRSGAITTISEPEPILIEAKFNGQTIRFEPKFYVPNGDIKTYVLLPIRGKGGIPEFSIIDRNIPVKKNVLYSNAEGDAEPVNQTVVSPVKSKSSSVKYVKQRDFILILTAIGALSGFSRAKLLKSSTKTIALTTLIYGGVAALASWGIASVINDK